ncbi:MAG: hypothetical protein IKO48_06970 [Elusimicrobia bacterium]|nr:hypothetical protein [Elusimicrobiota bacterium]
MKKIKEFIWNKVPFVKFIHKQIICFIKYLQFLIVKQRQKKVYKNLCLIAKQNKRKLKIGFLVNENEKWCCQTLYDKLKQGKHFEPIILLTSLNEINREKLDEKYSKNVEFFNKYCNNIQIVYNNKTKQFDNLEKYKIDIVVYQQPWFIAKNQNLFSISKYALAIYIPYAFVEEYEIINMFKYNFHYMLFKEYISHEFIEQEYKNKGYKENNLKVVGYTKLDRYSDNKKYEKKYVIYAPHHSFGKRSLKLGTFEWNGKYILEYAKKHSDFNWVFKPHPRLKTELLKNNLFKNTEEIDAYYSEWAKIGSVYEEGNYIDLFKQTKCLITDCLSFLVEFLPAESPVINLKRKDSVCIPQITDKISKAYYQVYDLEELQKILFDVLEKNIDVKKQERLNLKEELNIVRNASDNIIEDLENTFCKNF